MRPLVIAHRGASGELPENTLPAFERALAQRADMIETDLHRTRDGAVVLCHDAEPACLGGRAALADATLAELRALEGGDGASIPTLDEALDAFGARIPFNLEIKRGARGPYPGIEEAVIAAVERRGLLARTLFSGFDDAALAALRRRAPSARIGLLLSWRSAERPLTRARSLGAEALHPWVRLVTPELVRSAHGEGLAVYVFTVDAVEEMRRVLDLGVDGLFTNHPARMRALLDPPGG